VKVLLFFGGPSEERDVSAGSIKPWVTYLEADPTAELTVVFVDRELRPYRMPPVYYYANTCADFETQLSALDLGLDWDEVAELARSHDVAVPLIHGEFGEDGALQRRLEAWGIPYVFSEPDALERTLDKDACYATLAAAGFPVPTHRPVTRQEWDSDRAGVLAALAALAPVLGTRDGGTDPLVAVKPLTGGSSFGVDVVPVEERALADAVDAAFAATGGAVLVEEFLGGTEFSVVVLDGPGRVPTALAPTEVEKPPASLVYGTEEKYLHGSGVIHHTPMRVDQDVLHGIRRRAAEAFGVLGLRHMARIDGFRTEDGTVVVTDVNGIGGMGFSSFVFQQAAMVGIDHRRLIMGLLRAALGTSDVTAEDAVASSDGARRIHVVLGGPTSERQVSRQSGCFVGLSLLASGSDVRFFLMDLQSRYTEIGLFYVLHHDVEEIQALVGDPMRRATIEAVGATVRADFAMGAGAAGAALLVGPTVAFDAVADCTDFVFLALHGGPGEDGRLQLALERRGVPYNGSGPRAADLAGDKAATAARVRALALAGIGAPAQREVDIFELGTWLDGMAGPGGAAARYGALCDELSARVLVCKPASDGCSTGVKLLRRPEVMERFFTAIVAEAPEFATDEARSDLRGRAPTVAMPVPAPKRWLIERAFVDPATIELPPGDLNLGTLRPWFAAKQFIELTVAVLDRRGRGLVAAVPSVTVAADELTLQQKFQSGVGTNLALDLFVADEVADSVRLRVEQLARAFDIEGYARLDVFWDRVDDVVYLLEINSLCGLTEATVFYSQWLADKDSAPPWAVLDRIVEAGIERSERLAGSRRAPRAG
jgi:UDP-N-acetylmuramate--alanine ligase